MASFKRQSTQAAEPAVIGENTGGGDGTTGASNAGNAVHGISQTGTGVLGESVKGPGLHGTSTESDGVLGEGPVGVYGRNTLVPGNGVIGYSDAGRGVWGHSNQTGTGVLGEAAKGPGVHGTSVESDGVLGEGPVGVYGRNTLVPGNGVIGYSDAGRGVWGHSNQTGTGVLGEAAKGPGVHGTSTESDGVLGEGPVGVYGRNTRVPGNGVIGYSDAGRGVWGHSNQTGTGVLGEAAKGVGVHGVSTENIGVYGKGGRLAGFFEGDVEVTGDIRLANADCAEDFDVSGADKVEPGTVMVLGGEGALSECREAYDKRVAGVISGAGDYKPGIVMDKRETSGNRQPIALMGKVFCKVDARFGAIEVGDLLTSSSTPGHAMKTSDPLRAFGSVIGKALRPQAEGKGLIPILISLQ